MRVTNELIQHGVIQSMGGEVQFVEVLLRLVRVLKSSRGCVTGAQVLELTAAAVVWPLVLLSSSVS